MLPSFQSRHSTSAPASPFHWSPCCFSDSSAEAFLLTILHAASSLTDTTTTTARQYADSGHRPTQRAHQYIGLCESGAMIMNLYRSASCQKLSTICPPFMPEPCSSTSTFTVCLLRMPDGRYSCPAPTHNKLPSTHNDSLSRVSVTVSRYQEILCVLMCDDAHASTQIISLSKYSISFRTANEVQFLAHWLGGDTNRSLLRCLKRSITSMYF